MSTSSTREAASRPDLRIVADGYHAAPGVMEVLTLPNSGITTPQDLEGKTIGTTEPQVIPVQKGVPYSLETVATQSVLENDGVNPARVKWKPLPSGDLINALADRQVNAILIQEPYIYEAESRLGAIEVLDSCSGATASLPLSGYFAAGVLRPARTRTRCRISGPPCSEHRPTRPCPDPWKPCWPSIPG